MPVDRPAQPGTADPLHASIACGEAVCQLPFIVFASWWNAVVQPVLELHPHRTHPSGSEDHQLVVPEPIEEEGEHALFA